MDDWDEEFEDGSQYRPLKRFPNFHHSSPLIYYPQRHIISLYNKEQRVKEIPLFSHALNVIEAINKRRGMRVRLSDDPSVFYSRVFRETHDSIIVQRDELELRTFMNALDVSRTEALLDLQAIIARQPALVPMKNHLELSPAQLENVVDKLSSCFLLYRQLTRKRNLIQLVHVTGTDHTALEGLKICGFTLYSFNELILMIDELHENQAFLLNYDQYLMVVDTVASRMMTRLACSLNDLTNLDDLPSDSLLTRVYGWGDEILDKCGVNGYAVIGEYESIATNAFVNFAGSDPLKLGIPYFEAVQETAREIETEWGISSDYTRELISIFSSVQSPNQLSELFGIRKHWGNPMVDAKASGRAVQDKIKEDLPIDGESLITLKASFNRLIVLEFIKKNGRWPECEFPEQASHTLLYKCWIKKINRIPEKSFDHEHEHWSYLKFLPNCTLDSYKDQLSYLSDKSVSLYRHNLMASFVQALVPENMRCHPEENRRIMLEFLRRDHLDILEIFSTVMTDTIPKEWLCNLAAMKGTEMKHNRARIFAVLTYELRQYFALSEELIKEHIFIYNPHQTMTMSEVDLLGRLKGLTSQLQLEGKERHLSVIHIIDFSKWNLRMKYDNTCSVFKSIDDFLGTPGLIEMTHKVFERLLNVVQDAFNPPQEDIESVTTDTIWRDHIGGWEGQRQKGWTVVTSALLSYVELLTGVHSEICGQGDNQVLLSRFVIPSRFQSAKDWVMSDRTGVRAVLDDFYKVLENECTKVGLKVKSAETCRSLCYLNYGKRLYFTGIELSMTLKRISRMVTEPNDAYPTTENRLKTMEGAIYAANLYGHPSLLSYLMSRIGVYLSLDEAFRYNPLVGDTGLKQFTSGSLQYGSSFLSTIMKVPSSLGGPPQQPLSAYLCRGHPDPLCTDLVMVTLRASYGDHTSKRLLTVFQDPEQFPEDKKDKTALIASPYSLNLEIPLSAKKPLEGKVHDAVSSYCKNMKIKPLFNTKMDRYSRRLLDNIGSMKPFNPLVANDMFSRTAPGRRQSFISGLCNSTSLSRLVKESSSRPLIQEVCELERKQLLHWIYLWVSINEISDTDDLVIQRHHILAQQLRDRSWGVTVNGVTVPHPLELFSLVSADSDLCSSECHACEPEHIVLIQHNEDLVSLNSGRNNDAVVTRSMSSSPYLGNVVNEGLTQSDIKCLTPSLAWLDVIRLNVVKKWVANEGTPFHRLFNHVIQTRTDLPQELVDRATGRPSRLSYNHRAALMGTIRSCAPSTTTNLHTRFYLSSNRMGRYSHGDTNFHLAFGPAFLIAQALLSLKLAVTDGTSTRIKSERKVYHFHLTGSDVPPVYDGQLEIFSKETLNFPEVPEMLICRAKDLEFDTDVGSLSNQIWDDEVNLGIEDCKIMYAFQLTASSFISEITHRELFSVESLINYPPRQAPITIGDISSTGVEKFCEALASQCLMVMPLQDLVKHDRTLVLCRAYNFLNTFSSDFWSAISPSLAAVKHTKSLVKLNDRFLCKHLTQKNLSVIELVKVVTAGCLWKLWENLVQVVMETGEAPNLILAAPNVSALRPLLSRYFELCITALARDALVSQHHIFELGRDMTANIHTGQDKDLKTIFIACQSQFRRLSRDVLKISSRALPIPLILSLHYPWIDQIRETREDEEDLPAMIPVERESLQCSYFYHKSYLNPDKIIWVDSTDCDCNRCLSSFNLQWQNYFQPCGFLSKSFYTIIECILAYNLNLREVAVIGSKSGSEAAAISLHGDNSLVYVSCHQKLSSFSPHNAATYIPPAFLSDGDSRKLVRSSSAALCSNDLECSCSVNELILHLKEYNITGLVVDLSVIEEWTSNLPLMVHNSMVICSSLGDVGWALFKVKYVCHHSFQKLLSELACKYVTTDVCYSYFSPFRSVTVLIICQKPKSRETSRTGEGKVAAHLDDAQSWGSLITSVLGSQYPVCLTIPRDQMVEKTSRCSLLRNSFVVSCMTYLPGWGIGYKENIELHVALEDLLSLTVRIKESMRKVVNTSLRVAIGLPIIRTGILERSSANVNKQLENMAMEFLRARLLIDILSLTRVDFKCISDLVLNFLSQTHQLIIGRSTMNFVINQGEFIRRYSGSLFELLGHLFRHKSLSIEASTRRIYHTAERHIVHYEVDFPSIMTLDTTVHPQYSDHNWRWDRRALVMAAFLVSWAMPEKKIQLKDKLSLVFSQDELKLMRLDCLMEDRMNCSNETISLFWVISEEPFPSELPDKDVAIICDSGRYSELASYNHVNYVYALPWSGVFPSLIVSIVRKRNILSHETKRLNTAVIASRMSRHGLRLIGCQCYSCSVEVAMREHFSFSSAQISKVCSLDKYESVFQKKNKNYLF